MGVGQKTYALGFNDACFPDITLSSGVKLIRATTSFTRSPQTGKLTAMQIFFRDPDHDEYDVQNIGFDPALALACPGTIDLGSSFLGVPVVAHAGKKQVGTVSVRRIILAP